ncbi:MAG: SMC family ATPase [Jatrophihabitantaceae bacterium]
MRLHRLSLTAIGPFAGQVDIDLARFGDNGLFLIEGPTGADKSTILDSISFALYGKLAQRAATAERLKSHHAAPATEPVVELVFETQSGIYRIRRTPSFERPKKRGTGTTPISMTVKLWRLNSPDDQLAGELLSHNLGDVEDEITRAVGLSHAQFVQTVLLPQGEFANFLRADTSAKRSLLQRLFGTELIAATQNQLIEGRRVAEQRRTTALDAVRRASHAYAGAVGLTDEQSAELDRLAEAGDRAALAGYLDQLQAALADREQQLAASHAQCTEHRRRADAQAQHSRDLTRRRAARTTLRDERQRLLDAAEQVEARRVELAAAERALRVSPSAQALATAIQQSDLAQDAQTRARDQLPETLYGADETRLREASARHRTTIGTLAVELRRERGLIARNAELAQLSRAQQELAEFIEQSARQQAVLPERRAELAEARERAILAAGQLDGLVGERDRAAARLQAARLAARAAQEAEENQQLAREVFEAAEQQQKRLAALRTSWRASIASELGLALQTGDPCAVCGSIEHPKPARPAAGYVSQDQVTSAEDELRRLSSDVEQRRRLLADQQAELIRLQLQAEQLTPKLAQRKLDAAGTKLAAVQAEADRVAALDAGLAELDRELAELDQQLHTAARQDATLAQQSSTLQATIEQDELAVHLARDGYPTVIARVADLERGLAAIEAAATATANASAAVATARQAGAGFTAALAAAEFNDQDDWQRAQRSSSALARLRVLVKQHDEQVTAVQARLGSPELTDPALDDPAADQAGLDQAVQAAVQAEDGAAQAHGAASGRSQAAIEHGARVTGSLRRTDKVRSETAPAIRVGNLVAGLGENQLKMELTTYVLVRRFADILAAANSQLTRISEGRYLLEHSDARTGNARSGLGLRVLDLHTGRTRDPATLSGGETFYVSLSLALGLADIVRAESGGIDLGTLLIDEGFGYLDDEVLEQVLTVLDGLRAGGRVVGVVSHVHELKLRIADRIEVRSNPDGSSRVLATA